MKWKEPNIIEIVEENKRKIRNQQTDPYLMQLHTARTLNQNRNSNSSEPIITIPRTVLGVAIGALAFTIIPIFPIVVIGMFCYWLAKQTNK